MACCPPLEKGPAHSSPSTKHSLARRRYPDPQCPRLVGKPNLVTSLALTGTALADSGTWLAERVARAGPLVELAVVGAPALRPVIDPMRRHWFVEPPRPGRYGLSTVRPPLDKAPSST